MAGKTIAKTHRGETAPVTIEQVNPTGLEHAVRKISEPPLGFVFRVCFTLDPSSIVHLMLVFVTIDVVVLRFSSCCWW